jgi:Xaa-Pro aminopeptidase
LEEIKSEFYINNRQRLRSLFTGTAPIVLTANGAIQQTSDMTYPFRQDSSFWYFSGLDEPGAILVIEKTKEYIILPNRPKFTDIEEGELDISSIIDQSGITEILDYQEGWRRLSNKIKRAKHAAILPAPPAYIESYGFYTNPARAQLQAKLKEINEEISFLDIRKHIVKLRLIKQPIEIESIENAIYITANVIKKVQKRISKYEYEYEVDAFILSEFRRVNSKPAFTNIVSTGINSVAIHYNKGDTKLSETNLILLDIGAETNHYAADITRTFSIGEKISKRQKQILNAVVDVQQYAYSIIKPGVVYIDYENKIEQYMGEKLRELGLINSIDTDSVRKYFPHLTSHFLGLDPHDVGDRDTVFQENMVITVEPGIYIHEESIGIRIEDDVLITKDGIRILSVGLPSTFN